MLQLAVLLAALPAATVEPAQLPAHGRQAAILTMERAGMVRLQAKGGDGTACSLVDQLRGPFASSGVAGREDCSLDLLLDVGRYKVRLDSQAKAASKAKVSLTAAIFEEVNATPIGLSPGRPVEAQLPEGKQASFWFRVEKRGPVAVRVAGRTAGAVHLWRAGEWREELTPAHFQPDPGAGQPIHEWWVQGVLEPGDYQVTAYGTAPLRFTRGEESSLLTVELGFATAQERTLRAVLPASGTVAVATAKEPLTALLSVENPGTGRVRVSVHPARDDGYRMQDEEGNCVVEPKAQVAECAIRVGDGAHVLLVRGAAGAAIHLRWVPRRPSSALLDGEYLEPQQRLPMEPLTPGEYLLGIHDVPGDRDASPLGCALERQPERGGPREIQAWDAPKVSGSRTYQRAFNYNRWETLWFEVTEGGEYAISTGGERKSSCELNRVIGDGLERLTEGDPRGCRLTKRLSPGLYELKITGGTEGIEKVRIGVPGKETGEAPARSACFLRTRLDPGYRYTMLASRTGRVAARGLVARRVPVSLETPLPVEIPAGETFSLPISASVGQLRVATPGGSPAGCHLAKGGAGQWRDGACWLNAQGQDELGIAAKPGAPLLAWIMKPAAPRPVEPPKPFQPAKSDLPRLAPGEISRFDFEPGQQRALVFDVKEAGLYDVGTEGLLATSCSLRTPALSRLATDRRGGRGRNCLVSAWLRPGRYLVAVGTEAPSRGRAGVALTRRPAREVPKLDGEGERFFRVEAGELVRQQILVPKAGRWELAATALGAQLRCRLEDRDGWPLEAVPGPCKTTQELPQGEILWTQLPLTVESMRRNAAAPERPPVVLRGATEVHDLALWRSYTAELGKDGKDDFRFALPAEGDVSILLTNGMLGRLYREGETQAIEIVPPADGGAPVSAGSGDMSGQEDSAEPDESASESDSNDGDGDAYTEGDEGGGDESGESEESGEEQVEPPPPAPVHRAIPPVVQLGAAPGYVVHLAAGTYRLVAEHSRGDVAIAYGVQVSVDPLMPGVQRDLPVPSRVPIRIATAGTLRIRTAGEADVRCRLFDASGRLVAQSSEVGEDWNCGMAEPMAAGDYRLELESEMVTPGVTRLSLAEPAPSDVGALADGKKYPLGEGVLSAALPPPATDAVVEASLEGPAPFSCAVDDDAGRLVTRSGAAKSCTVFLLPAGKTWRLRAWTLDRPTEVTARFRVRPVSEFDGGKLPANGAGRAKIERPGTWQTAEGVQCLAAPSGLLVPCGPEVSLEAGPVVFAAPGQPKVSLDERVVELSGGEEKAATLGPRMRIQRQESGKAAAHLVAVTVAPGEGTVPACRIEGGVHTAAPGGCFAASSSGKASLLRLRASEPVEARVWRAAVTKAKEVELEAGIQRLDVAPGGTLAELPSGAVRAALTLPPRAWAVMLADGKAVDLCAPSQALAPCVLSAKDDAELLLFAQGEGHVEAVITRLPAAPVARDLAGLREELAPLPGSQTWAIPAAGAERTLRVDGAVGCSVALDDGARSSACTAEVPAGVGGTVTVEHRAGPLRLLLAPRGDALALAGPGLGSGSPKRLAAGEAVALEGGLVERGIELPGEAVVHVRADRGTCLLVSGGAVVASGGMGEGCRLDRLLAKGEHRLVVRAFAGAPLGGNAAWTAESVETLSEGIGAERWLSPGEARIFRFTLASKGRVGLGLREEGETLSCAVADAAGRTVGEGCQQLLSLEAGSYLLSVRAPAGAPASRFKPVLLGLAGSETGVPDEYLRDFFQRIGGTR